MSKRCTWCKHQEGEPEIWLLGFVHCFSFLVFVFNDYFMISQCELVGDYVLLKVAGNVIEKFKCTSINNYEIREKGYLILIYKGSNSQPTQMMRRKVLR